MTSILTYGKFSYDPCTHVIAIAGRNPIDALSVNYVILNARCAHQMTTEQLTTHADIKGNGTA